MRKFQQGGSVIYDVDTGRGVPDVNYVPTLEVPELKFTALSSALDMYEKIKQEEERAFAGNMEGLNKVYDGLSKVRYDNHIQQAEIESAKKRSGLTEDILNLSVEQLKNPYIMAPISRAASQFANDMGIRGIMQEQAVFDAALASYAKNPPANPVLRQMFGEQVNKYKNGELKGTDISPQDYQEIDLAGELGKMLKDIPLYTRSELVERNGIVSEHETKQRSQKAIEAVIGFALSTPSWVNNMKARGFVDQTGQLTQAGMEWLEGIRDAYVQSSLDIKGITRVPGAGARGGAGGSGGAGGAGGSGGGAGGGRISGLGESKGYKGADAAIYDDYANVAAQYGLDPTSDPELSLLIAGAIEDSRKGGDRLTSQQTIEQTITRIRARAMDNPSIALKAWYDQATKNGYAGSPEDFMAALKSTGYTAAQAGAQPVDPAILKALDQLRPTRQQQTWDSLRNASMAPTAPQMGGGGAAGEQQAPSASGISDYFMGGGMAPQASGGGGGSRTTANRASYDAATLDKLPAIPDGDIRLGPTFVANIIAHEGANGGRDPGKNPMGTASGYAGFTNVTWLTVINSMAKKDRDVYNQVVGKTKAEILAMRMDPATKELQQKAVLEYAQMNSRRLIRAGLTPDDVHLGMAHYLGASGAIKLLKAPRNALFRDVVSADSYNSNPHDHYVEVDGKRVREKTVQDVINRVAANMGFYTPQTWKLAGYRNYKTWQSVAGDSPKRVDRINARLVSILDNAASELGWVPKVNSSYRNHQHNKEAGGVSDSQHLRGDAMDITLRNLTDQQKKDLLRVLMKNGVSFVHFYGAPKLHIDIRYTGIDKTKFSTDKPLKGKVPAWAEEFVK